MTAEAWLHLLAAADPGTTAWPAALRAAGNPDRLLGMRGRDLAAIGLKSKHRDRLAAADRTPVAAWHSWLAQPERTLVTLGSPEYPVRLAELADAPLALWTIGRGVALLSAPQLAIVGSRHPTAGGRATAVRFARAVSHCGITVTSGLARGIDGAAHEGALAGVGGTLAVLGCGIDRIYPRAHRPLAARVAAAGAIVSEYAPGTPARPGQFPRRNRIIAGLTLGTLVVEAASRSGSLITARLAAEFGREVFAIPGSIHSTLSKGCHGLLREGAKLVEQVNDILVEIAPGLRYEVDADEGVAPLRADRGTLDAGRRKLLKLLDFAPATIAELLPGTGLTAAELSSMLLHLEMEGTVEALPGGRYCRLVKRS